MTVPNDSEDTRGFHFGLDDLPEAAFVTDHNHVITDANPATLKILGYAREEMVGWSLEKFFPEEPRGTSLLLAGTGGSTKFEITLRTKAGKTAVMSFVASPVRRFGTVKGILYLGRDIRLRKLIEGEVRKARDYFRAVLQDAPNGICITDLNRTVIVANHMAEALTGCTTEEIVGNPVTALYPPDPAARALDIAALQRGEKFSRELDLVKKDGTKSPVLAFYRAVEDEQGDHMIVESYSDVSDRKRLDKLKNEFVFIAAHELRNPVSAIRLLLNIIFEDKRIILESVLRGYLLKMQEADERLLQLVDDLLEVSRNESGRLKIDASPQDITEHVEAIFSEIRPNALTRDVTLVHHPLPIMPKVMADPSKLKEIFANLVSNGVKYNVAGGSVTVEYQVQDNFLLTRVSDTGIGISDDDKEKLFEKFWRSEEVAVRAQAGTGLGLFIVKELVLRMGGQISVESVAGKGTTFLFSLPLAS